MFNTFTTRPSAIIRTNCFLGFISGSYAPNKDIDTSNTTRFEKVLFKNANWSQNWFQRFTAFLSSVLQSRKVFFPINLVLKRLTFCSVYLWFYAPNKDKNTTVRFSVRNSNYGLKCITKPQYSSDLWTLKVKRNSIVDKSLKIIIIIVSN